MTDRKRDDLERVSELFEGLPEARPETKEAVRAALMARFEEAEGGAAGTRRPRGWLGRRAAALARACKRRARLGFALAGGACAAALVAVTIVVSGGEVASRAYAVELQPSGLVYVSISRLDEPERLQQALREAGVPSVVEFKRSDRALAGQRELPHQFRRLVLGSEISTGGCLAKAAESSLTVEFPAPSSLESFLHLDPRLEAVFQRAGERVKKEYEEIVEGLSPKATERIRRVKKNREREGKRLEREAREKSFRELLLARMEQVDALPVPEKAKRPLRRQIRKELRLYEEGRFPSTPLELPFTFVPTEDFAPPTGGDGVTFIVEPRRLRANERLHILTTGKDLRSMVVYTNNAICLAGESSR